MSDENVYSGGDHLPLLEKRNSSIEVEGPVIEARLPEEEHVKLSESFRSSEEMRKRDLPRSSIDCDSEQLDQRVLEITIRKKIVNL